MNLFNLAILLFLFGMFSVGQNMYLMDTKVGYTQNISNVTVLLRNAVEMGMAKGVELPNPEFAGVARIISSFSNFVGVLLTEVSASGVTYGYNHPEYDFITFFKYLTIAIIGITLLSLLTPLLVVLYCIYLGFVKLKEGISKWLGRIKKPVA